MSKDIRIEISTLANGITVITEDISIYDTVAIGIWSKYGSVQDNGQAGLCHFFEHMLFKGTATYSRQEIACKTEELGGQFNASTDFDTISLFTKVTANNLSDAVELLADMAQNSIMEREAMDIERQVIASEIKKYNDIPQERVIDLFNEAYFGGGSLSRPILGFLNTITKISPTDLKAARDFFFAPKNIIITAAGQVNHALLCAIANDKYTLPNTTIQPTPYIKGAQKKINILQTDDELINFCFAGKSLAASDSRQYALSYIDTIFGGSTTSILFQKIREELGISYDISSYDYPYLSDGVYGVYGSVERGDMEQTMDIIRSEIATLKREKINHAQMEFAKSQLTSQLLLNAEDTITKNDLLADNYLNYGKIMTEKDIFIEIERVNIDDVNALLEEVLCPEEWTFAAIGNLDDDMVTLI